jgi:hypothetical protein
MNTIARALLLFFTLAFATTSQAQVDVAIQGALPLSNVRLFAGNTVPVTVGILNLGPNIVQATQVNVTIRTYTNIIVYSDSVIVSGVHNYVDSVRLKPFEVTETGFYAVFAKVTTKDDKNIENNSYSNPRVSYQADPAIVGIISPILNDVKLQKLPFTLRGKFKSNSLYKDLEVRARVEIRRCLDSALMFAADDIIPELPKDTVSVLFDFPTKQGIYDVRKLDPGCYFVKMMTNSMADFDHSNDALTNIFSVKANTLPNDVLTDVVNSIKDKTIKPNEPLPLHFLFGNVGSNMQPSTKVHVVITNEDRAEVYHQQDTLNNWYPFESRAKDFPAFKTDIGGTYKLRAYTALTNDEYRYNDTVTATITVEKLFKITADTVLSPTPDQAFAVGVTFVPKARFSWSGNSVPTGNLKAMLVLKSKTSALELPFVGSLSGFSESSRSLEVSFPTPIGGRKWSELTRGEYTATAYALVDDKTVSIANPVSFRVAFQHDVKIDSFISPIPFQSYALGEIEVSESVKNIGLVDESTVQLDAVITDRKKDVVYEGSAIESIAVLARKPFALPSFTPLSKGMYDVTFRLSMPVEDDTLDGNLLRQKFHVGSPYDAALIEAITPLPNSVIEQGTAFIPGVMLDWYGIDNVVTPIPMSAVITKCDNAQVVYEQHLNDGFDASFQTHVVGFSPSSIDGTFIRDLPTGCYNLTFIASHPQDGDRSDDTLVVPFSIEETSDVNARASTFAIERISQNGSSLNVALAGEYGAADYRLYDLHGNIAVSGSANGASFSISMEGLASGSYILEVRSKDEAIRHSISYLK